MRGAKLNTTLLGEITFTGALTKMGRWRSFAANSVFRRQLAAADFSHYQNTGPSDHQLLYGGGSTPHFQVPLDTLIRTELYQSGPTWLPIILKPVMPANTNAANISDPNPPKEQKPFTRAPDLHDCR